MSAALGVAGIAADLARLALTASRADPDTQVAALHRIRRRLIIGRGVALRRDTGRWWWTARARSLDVATIDAMLAETDRQLARWDGRAP